MKVSIKNRRRMDGIMAVIPFHTVDKIMNRKVNLWFADIAML
jgi:hypothetical protein